MSVVNSFGEGKILMPTKPGITHVVVKGMNSEIAIEMDLDIIHQVMEWFVAEAPKELRNLKNVGRVIRFNDQLIDLIDNESKSSIDYIEKKSIERLGLPTDGYAKITGT